MPTTKKKSPSRADGAVDARAFLERLNGGPLTFGDLLAAIREGEELSLSAFAAQLGTTAAKICDIEKGRRGVSPERAAAWAKLLGYSEAQFVKLALQAQLDAADLAFEVAVSAKKPRRKAG